MPTQSTFLSEKSAPTLLRYTPSLSLALLPNGGSIICIVILPHPRGMVTSSQLLIILQNGLRQCLHMQRMVILPPSFFLITSQLGLEFHKLQSLIMVDLSTKPCFHDENSNPYYPQANGQVEAINKVLKTMLRRTVGNHKSNQHLTLFYALWDYRTLVKTTTSFTPFQLVYGLELVLQIECNIPSLKLQLSLS